MDEITIAEIEKCREERLKILLTMWKSSVRETYFFIQS